MHKTTEYHPVTRTDGEENKKKQTAANIYDYLTSGRARQTDGEAHSTIPEDTTQEFLPQANNYLRPEGVKQEDITLSLADLKTILEERNKNREADLKTAEEKARQAKNKQTIALIGDAITAMSNLYFTYKGASNNFDPQKYGLSGKAKERYDKYIAEYEKNKDKISDGKLKDLFELHKLQERQRQFDAKLNETKRQFDAKQPEKSALGGGTDLTIDVWNPKGTNKIKYPIFFTKYWGVPPQYLEIKRTNTDD